MGAVAETYTVGGISDRTVSVKERRMVAARGRTSMVSVLSTVRNWQQPAKVRARFGEGRSREMLMERAKAMAAKAGTVRGAVARSSPTKSWMLE